MSIGIMGAGAFGTSLAIALSDQSVTLWAHDADHVRDMASHRENTRRLPGVSFPKTVSVTQNRADLVQCDTVLLTVPTQKLASLLVSLPDGFGQKALVACCKGIDLKTGLRPTQTIQAAFPNAIAAILTGPSFATEIAVGLPTALTLACEAPKAAEHLQSLISTPTLRIYTSSDCIGAELGGALKNVIAIATGAAIGAGLGESARAALMTRGFAEMTRFASALGADPHTLAGLSGFGDLVLTCASEKSRNYRFGLALGQGRSFDASVTVEGSTTSKAVIAQAKTLGLDLPITEMVVALVEGKVTVTHAISALLARPLRKE